MTDRDRVLRVEADTQHISTVSLQSRHLELQAPSNGSCAVFCYQYKSLLENISDISCIFALTKMLAPIHKSTKYVLQLTSLSVTCDGCHGIYDNLQRSLQKTSEIFEFFKRPHLR